MTQYACVQCCETIPEGDYDCRCGGLAVEVLEPEPQPASVEQRTYIRYLYRRHGLHGLPWILEDVSRRAGHPIARLSELTADDYTRIVPALREWSYGL